MRSMKTRGAEEISAALQRVRRLHALGRVHGPDKEYIEQRLLEVQSRIVAMQETDEDGEEV